MDSSGKRGLGRGTGKERYKKGGQGAVKGAAEKGGRGAVKWRQKKEVRAPGRPKENGGRAYALPPFVMRGCALLRLPDQNTMTGLRKQLLICENGSRKLRLNITTHVCLSAVDDQMP